MKKLAFKKSKPSVSQKPKSKKLVFKKKAGKLRKVNINHLA